MAQNNYDYSKILQSIISSLNSFSKVFYDFTKNHGEKIIESTLKFYDIISKIDFSKLDTELQKTMLEYLVLGFYPSKTCIGKKEINYLLDLKNYKDKEASIAEDIEYSLKIIQPKLISTFPDKETYINEIFKLYHDENYRLCILSLINLTSNIFNEKLEYIDFTEIKLVEKKLINLNIMNKDEKNYIIFAPYINKDNFKKCNYLRKNFHKTPDKYKEYPYNRNAILHGYSIDFGTKINCLRWFSVLINAYDIFCIFNEIKKES